MIKTFIVSTEKGRDDSLVHPVRIAFTLTPTKPQLRKEVPYYPIAYKIMDFRAGNDQVTDEQSQSFKWSSGLGFGVWTRRTEHSIQVGSQHRGVPPTHFAEFRTSPPSIHPRWTKTRPSVDPLSQQDNLVVASNKTPREQYITLGGIQEEHHKISETFHSFKPMVCYVIPAGYDAYAPSSLMLQAYIVNNLKDKANQLLFRTDLAHPIFPEPISCETLSPESKWRLCREKTGKINLVKEETLSDFDLEEARTQLEKINGGVGKAERHVIGLDQRLTGVETAQRGKNGDAEGVPGQVPQLNRLRRESSTYPRPPTS